MTRIITVHGLGLALTSLVACSCSRNDDERIERRLAHLEAQQALILEKLEAMPTENTDAAKQVAFDIGHEFSRHGDRIEILDIRGTVGHLEIGGHYTVHGRYALTSRTRASLLLSVTETVPLDEGLVSTGAALRIREGVGTFTLPLHLHSPGKPHVTIYDRDKHEPIAKVHFGAGDWLFAARPSERAQPMNR